ncbi:hypothetical protein CH251_04635 [Rhodococcus sp. 06-462-5]|uniref:hypothetical protein n=1 Tax=unclassified Rhodococcus (in: high G+C Gram-positive bacteria) TaxID=192944 RepID=UPI000B9C1106|nr:MULTISPECIES: hypothetical protein [unclassified Rhodococcus (in: high G+C Gram-positive bacteria)]OZC77960.1 hypothetical protein CH251_04635 [Rhodococcus sp. 06-462-5]OZE61811.1 hypothetical protein CH270_19025 [Rhodococcus sp. 02-925g]
MSISPPSTVSPLSIGPDEPYSEPKRFLRKLNPLRWLALADGIPVGLKNLAQLGLLIVWPVWFVWVLIRAVCFFAFWLLLSPVRSHQKKTHPVDFARAQARRLP